MEIPVWNPSYLAPILALSTLTIGFSLYHFVSLSEKLRARFITKYGSTKGPTQFLWFSRYLGCLSIGLIPFVLTLWVLDKSPADLGLSFKNTGTSLLWIGALACLIIPMNFFNARKPKNLSFYPNVREKKWTKGMVAHNAFTWIAYLFGYELMFRGLLLFTTVEFMGAWPAIILNTALYALVHIPKNLEETIGAVPLGLLLCLITLSTGTFWVAFGVHVCLALSNFFFSLRNHPEMQVS